MAIFTPAEENLFLYMYRLDRRLNEKLHNPTARTRFHESDRIIAELEKAHDIPEGMHEQVRDRYRQWIKQHTTFGD